MERERRIIVRILEHSERADNPRRALETAVATRREQIHYRANGRDAAIGDYWSPEYGGLIIPSSKRVHAEIHFDQDRIKSWRVGKQQSHL